MPPTNDLEALRAEPVPRNAGLSKRVAARLEPAVHYVPFAVLWLIPAITIATLAIHLTEVVFATTVGPTTARLALAGPWLPFVGWVLRRRRRAARLFEYGSFVDCTLSDVQFLQLRTSRLTKATLESGQLRYSLSAQGHPEWATSGYHVPLLRLEGYRYGAAFVEGRTILAAAVNPVHYRSPSDRGERLPITTPTTHRVLVAAVAVIGWVLLVVVGTLDGLLSDWSVMAAAIASFWSYAFIKNDTRVYALAEVLPLREASSIVICYSAARHVQIASNYYTYLLVAVFLAAAGAVWIWRAANVSAGRVVLICLFILVPWSLAALRFANATGGLVRPANLELGQVVSFQYPSRESRAFSFGSL